MKHLVIAAAGRRVEVKPSPTSPGCITLTIIGADRQAVACVTLETNAADVLGFALTQEAMVLDNIKHAEYMAQAAQTVADVREASKGGR